MNYRRKAVWAAIALVLVGLVAACGQSSVEVGMVETNLPGRWEASYSTFTGTKVDSVRAQAGETFLLDYEVEVNKGDLSIEIRHSGDGSLWDVSLQEDANDRVELDLEQDGPYTIAIEGDNAGGSFSLSWDLR